MCAKRTERRQSHAPGAANRGIERALGNSRELTYGREINELNATYTQANAHACARRERLSYRAGILDCAEAWAYLKGATPRRCSTGGDCRIGGGGGKHFCVASCVRGASRNTI